MLIWRFFFFNQRVIYAVTTVKRFLASQLVLINLQVDLLCSNKNILLLLLFCLLLNFLQFNLSFRYSFRTGFSNLPQNFKTDTSDGPIYVLRWPFIEHYRTELSAIERLSVPLSTATYTKLKTTTTTTKINKDLKENLGTYVIFILGVKYPPFFLV